MRATKVVALTAVVATAATLATAATPSNKQLFEEFKQKFNKKYSSATEESQRFAIFSQNVKRAAQLQASNPLAKFSAVSPFADLSAEEFRSTHHNAEKHYSRAVRKSASEPKVDFSDAQKLAAKGTEIDWRKKGAVTYVKNQGQCGSCWSFSTTGGIEGQWFLAGHTLTALSEQEFVSCDTIDHGCQGGLMDNAYTWILKAHNGSLVTETSYPYVSGGGQVPSCNMHNRKFGAQITGYENIAHSEDTMATWVFANGPLSIAVDASSWQTYTGGIMTNCVSQQLDHGVLIVGFDDNNQPPYWIVKNSWAATWGEDGYIRLEKGTDQCLITKYPCSSKVQKGGPTPPPTPPSPGKKEFTQRKCKNPKCSDCTDIVLPQDECITGQEYSYKASCSSGSLLVDAFTGRKCEGSSISRTHNVINTCSIVFDSKDTESFVQNLCHAPEPTPAPTHVASKFVQMNCQDAACSAGCQNTTFEQNQCLKLQNGGSAKADCRSDEVVMTEYPTSETCTGIAIPAAMPLNQCLANAEGNGYFENFCPGQGVSVSAPVTVSGKLATTRKH